MPVSNRQKWNQRSGVTPSDTKVYEIIAPDHKPDGRASTPFEGKYYYEGGKALVRMTEAEARFFVDMGALAPVVPPAETPA